MTAEQAMAEIWSILCPDCGPQDYENIVIAVHNAAYPDRQKPLIRRHGPVLVPPTVPDLVIRPAATWVATVSGLYRLHDGVYGEIPISKHVEHEWFRINWPAPNAVAVVDDPPNKRAYVHCAMDEATVHSHIFTFNYSAGISADEVRVSIDTIGAAQPICLLPMAKRTGDLLKPDRFTAHMDRFRQMETERDLENGPDRT